MKTLGRKFFERKATDVAKDLIGKFLVRKINGKKTVYMITETEAYEGLKDKASHASKGRTKRTEVMFGKPGIFYVYLIYGMYFILNVATGKEGHPAAVLIRGVEGINGPGSLTKKLKINSKFNSLPATPNSGLWFEDCTEPKLKIKILKTPRIGISYAGPIWSQKLWRFVYNK